MFMFHLTCLYNCMVNHVCIYSKLIKIFKTLAHCDASCDTYFAHNDFLVPKSKLVSSTNSQCVFK